ncbi:endo-beta-N-acetylglucosaminidase H [Devriesea agamarum]|uniref:endo-beta-N-acetylglucosaminidase H n=1 Tax=Devriesea agamarum TaxID=472569 RepID=UPI000AF61345|nr:endo-beta-N-acetylglucosaminidase H [Devriesea agamarum]
MSSEKTGCERHGFSRRAMLAALPAVAGLAAYGPSVAHASDSKVVSVVYVEVNSNDMKNVGDYVLEGTSTPVFDIAVIFAANINYENSSAKLFLNDRVKETLENVATQIRPIQAKGIKVLLSILGNHQGAGFANFPSQAAASDFAQELADVVNKYGLDGIDFDDEYANYGANGTAQPNESSFVHLVTALREKLGKGKLITFYAIGPSSERTVYDGKRAGDLINYAWNPWYGRWSVPQIPGMDKSQLSPAAVNIMETSATDAASMAERTKREGYGVFLTYNLTAKDSSGLLSSCTKALHGKATHKTTS